MSTPTGTTTAIRHPRTPRRAALRPGHLLVLALALGLALGLLAPLATPAAAQAPDVSYEVLSQATIDPLAIEVAADGRVIWTQRDGAVWVLTPEGVQVRAGTLAVSANACPTCLTQDEGHTTWHGNPNPGVVEGLEEGGLHGMLLATDFDETGRIYFYRSMPGTRNPGPETRHLDDGTPIPPTFGLFRLSTFVLTDLNVLDPLSEEVILEVPVEWDNCCHYGGSLNHFPDGTIGLTTGDDVHFVASGGYGPRDTRTPWHNGELSSANPADRRGKILRLMPDGSVPDGSQPGIVPNPFVGHEGWNPYIEDTSGTPGDGWIAFDPYVYALGFKQPWRATVHPQTGTMYVDDVGPDAIADDPERGPAGLEEINVIPFGGGGHYGWPRCIGDNLPYVDVDWETGQTHGLLDCSSDAPVSRPLPDAPVQEARTGMTGATMWYGRGQSERWPVVGTGGLTAEPVAVYPADADGPLRLPPRFDERLIVLEWSRNFIFTIPLEADGSMVLDNDRMERLTSPSLVTTNVPPGSPQGAASVNPGIISPIDGAVGPDGAFYFLEYGYTIYDNPYSRVSRLRCAGCTPTDPTRNYGLPVDDGSGAGGGLLDGTMPVTAAGLPGLPGWVPAAGLVLLLSGITVRRRRLVA